MIFDIYMDFGKIRTDFGGKTADFLRLICHENIQLDKNAVNVGSVLLCRGKIFLLVDFKSRLNLEYGSISYWYSVLEIVDEGIKTFSAYEFNETEIGDYKVIGTIDVQKMGAINNLMTKKKPITTVPIKKITDK